MYYYKTNAVSVHVYFGIKCCGWLCNMSMNIIRHMPYYFYIVTEKAMSWGNRTKHCEFAQLHCNRAWMLQVVYPCVIFPFAQCTQVTSTSAATFGHPFELVTKERSHTLVRQYWCYCEREDGA